MSVVIDASVLAASRFLDERRDPRVEVAFDIGGLRVSDGAPPILFYYEMRNALSQWASGGTASLEAMSAAFLRDLALIAHPDGASRGRCSLMDARPRAKAHRL